jgi:ubiquinone biosynthesis protein
MHLKRYREIASALSRHGLGYLVGVFGLERFVPFQRGLLGHARREEPYTRPEHVRLALEDLGATFIKFGQVLSTRPDLVPPAYLDELARLQDAAPPVPAAAVEEAIRSALGRPAGELFAHFDPEPLAAASIGQAHAATLRDGTDIVVKIRRPGVVEQVNEDVEILKNLAQSASRRWAAAEPYDLVGLADEFAETIRAELDYLREGRNAERFAANFADDARVHIPRVFWELSSSRVLTLERIRGTKINDLDELEHAGVDRKALARRAAEVVLESVFEHGFFHADPHPGNFFIEPGGRIGLIDFGMVGTLDDASRERLAAVLVAVTGRRTDDLVDALLDLGLARGPVDRAGLRTDLDHLLAPWYDQPLSEIPLGAVLQETLAVVRRRRLQLPSHLALLFKTLIMDEGLAVRLDPDFVMIDTLAPYAERLVVRQYSPARWVRRFGRAGLDAARLATELPRTVRRLLAALERGGLEVGFRPEHVEAVMSRFEALVNRLVLGVIVAAFIVGLAVLMLVYHPRGWEEWAGIAFGVGFVIAAALGLVLAWTIVRSRRR